MSNLRILGTSSWLFARLVYFKSSAFTSIFGIIEKHICIGYFSPFAGKTQTFFYIINEISL